MPGNAARRQPRHGGSHLRRAPSYSTVLIKISRVDIQVCRASPSIRAAIDTVAIIGDGSDQLYACLIRCCPHVPYSTQRDDVHPDN